MFLPTRRSLVRATLAFILAVTAGCSEAPPLDAGTPDAQDSGAETDGARRARGKLGLGDLLGMTREEIWSEGVEMLGWTPASPPQELPRLEMIERFLIERYLSDQASASSEEVVDDGAFTYEVF